MATKSSGRESDGASESGSLIGRKLTRPRGDFTLRSRAAVPGNTPATVFQTLMNSRATRIRIVAWWSGRAHEPLKRDVPMSADPDGPVTLMLCCDKCGQGINLWCEGRNENGQPQPITYTCPSCGADQQVETPAARVSASVRVDHLGTRMIISTIISGL